jgi:hypothetical protein
MDTARPPAPGRLRAQGCAGRADCLGALLGLDCNYLSRFGLVSGECYFFSTGLPQHLRNLS